jgi:hypothetical protein
LLERDVVWFWLGEEKEYQNANLNQKSEPDRPMDVFGVRGT